MLPVGGYDVPLYAFGIRRHVHSNFNERLDMKLTFEGFNHVDQIGELLQVFSVTEVVLPEGVKVLIGSVERKWKISLIFKHEND